MHTETIKYINSSSNAACEILELLPDTDFINELRNLINTQSYISSRLLIGMPISDRDCQELSLYAKEVEVEVIRIKHAQANQGVQ